LADNRQWWVQFDPLVVIVTAFNYDKKDIAVPKVVGPQLIPDPEGGGSPKYGTVLEDTLVAGPHPYRGGDVVISVRFYRVQRDNFVRSVLKTIDALSKISTSLHELEMVASVGGAILTGVEGVLGLRTTTCLAAYRGSLVPRLTKPFSAQFCALLTPPVPKELSALRVQDGRLFADQTEGIARYKNSEFLLLSVYGAEERDDMSRLPVNARRIAALKAVGQGTDGFSRAKGLLTAAYAEMLESPDMTINHADHLFELWRKELMDRRVQLEKTHALKDGAEEVLDRTACKLNAAMRSFSELS
jgi:hypothetical protein